MSDMLENMTPDARVHYAQLCAIELEQTTAATILAQTVERA